MEASSLTAAGGLEDRHSGAAIKEGESASISQTEFNARFEVVRSLLLKYDARELREIVRVLNHLLQTHSIKELTKVVKINSAL